MAAAICGVVATLGLLVTPAGAATVTQPVCVNNTVQYPAQLPAGGYSPDLTAAFRAICSAPTSNLVGLIKNPGTYEQSLYGSQSLAAEDASGELLSTRIAASVFPKLAGVLRFGAGASEIGTAGYVGWKVGRFIDTKWLKLTKNDADVASSTATDVQWRLQALKDISGGGFIKTCTTYYPSATGCSGAMSITTRPDLSNFTTSDNFVFVFGRPNGSGFDADLWMARAGLASCVALSPTPCAQSVVDYRSAFASAIPHLDVEELPVADGALRNDGWIPPNTDAPTPAGPFIVRTQEQMAAHLVVKVEDYTNQRVDYASTVAMPSDQAIRDAAVQDLLKPGKEGAARVIGHELDPDGVAKVDEVSVPDCRGLDYFGCVSALRQAGLVGNIVREVNSFTEAVITAGPGKVTKVNPNTGTIIDEDDTVTVHVNPALEAMPVLVPVIDAGTHLEDARNAVESVGLELATQVLSQADPAYGPSEVTSPVTTPQAHTRVHRGDTVTVQVNPPDAEVPGGIGGCQAWVTPSINLAPLNYAPVMQRFPFAVPAWLLGLLDRWVVQGVPPVFHVPFPFVQDGISIDFGIWEESGAMAIWRGTVLFVSFALLAWSFMGMVLGVRTED